MCCASKHALLSSQPICSPSLPQDLEERMGLDMEAAARRIEGQVLTIHGTDDRVIPVEDGQVGAWDREGRGGS